MLVNTIRPVTKSDTFFTNNSRHYVYSLQPNKLSTETDQADAIPDHHLVNKEVVTVLSTLSLIQLYNPT
jgi:hypothetical protein